MKTQALVKVDSLLDVVVAALAAAFVAIYETEGCPVVPGRDHALILGDHSTVAALHAVGARSSQICKPHEVGVEGGPNQLGVLEVKL